MENTADKNDASNLPSLADSVEIRLEGKTIRVPHGTAVGDVFAEHDTGREQPPLAAIVHNRCVDLWTPLRANTVVKAVDYRMREGVAVYRRTASLILLEAVRQLFGPVDVAIGQAQQNGYFHSIDTEEPFSAEMMQSLEERMRELVADDIPLRAETVSLEEARTLFAEREAVSRLSLLRTWWDREVLLDLFGGICEIHHYPVAPSTGLIATWQLTFDDSDQSQPNGVIIRFPHRGAPREVRPFVNSPRLVQTYRETAEWLRLLGVETVGQLNALTIAGEAGELIRIAEGLHEKKIAQIADAICRSRETEPIRLVLIAGPSSSGKTTFSKRLSLQLQVNGVRPVALSTDNFYVNRVDTPLDEHGKYDYEAIEAIDLGLFNEVLAALLRGEEVLTPRFDFTLGERRSKDRWIPLRLEQGQVLVVEGIHGLNPRLTAAIPERQKFKIYINALTQVCVDDHNRIFTSDTRFLRRIVRDRCFRGYSATQTIENWPSVRRGEMRNIFPYQEEADEMFNSALPYEHAVLRLSAERFLLEVPPDHPSYVDAFRLSQFIKLFVPMFDESIPQTSLLREFIGGSFFAY